jgi:hypothetical protein
MIMFGVIVMGIWNFGPAWWHPYLKVLGALALLGVFLLLIRYILNDRAERAKLASRSEYRWPAGWDVQAYHRVLLTYLKVHDWRIQSAQAADADRLLLCLQRDRHRLTALLLRPGLDPVPDDIAYLRAMQRRDATWESALISDASTRQEPAVDATGTRLLMLHYDALPALTDALDGGSEDERRARAEKAERRRELEDARA